MKASASKRVIALLIVAVLVLPVAGCTGTPSWLPEMIGGTPVTVDPPGIYNGRGDRVRALGVLDRTGDGSWVLVGVAGAAEAQTTVIAVIENPDALGEDELVELRGRYVEVTGTLLDSTSSAIGGPRIRARDIERLGDELE